MGGWAPEHSGNMPHFCMEPRESVVRGNGSRRQVTAVGYAGTRRSVFINRRPRTTDSLPQRAHPTCSCTHPSVRPAHIRCLSR